MTRIEANWQRKWYHYLIGQKANDDENAIADIVVCPLNEEGDGDEQYVLLVQVGSGDSAIFEDIAKYSSRIKNIKAGIFIGDPKELKLAANGERLYDYEKEFHSRFYNLIQSSLDHNNWGVWFKQFSEENSDFIVDIYTDNREDYIWIANTITSNIPTNYISLKIMPPEWGFATYIQAQDQA